MNHSHHIDLQGPQPVNGFKIREWETKRLRQTRYQLWLDLHRGLAESSSRGEQRIVPNSDHLLMLSQPEAVVSAVHDVFTAVTSKGPATGH